MNRTLLLLAIILLLLPVLYVGSYLALVTPDGSGGGGDVQGLCSIATTRNASLIGYTGRPFEAAVGLGYNLTRWHDPATANWLSEDSIGFAGEDSNPRRYGGKQCDLHFRPLGVYHTNHLAKALPCRSRFL